MPDPFSTTFAASGIVRVVSPNPDDQGPYGWQLACVPSSDWAGYFTLNNVTLSVDATPNVLAAANLTPIASTDANGNPLLAGQQFWQPTVVVVNTPAPFSCYANVTRYAGSMRVTSTPSFTAPVASVPFSSITIDSIPPQYDDEYEIVLALTDAGGLTDS